MLEPQLEDLSEELNIKILKINAFDHADIVSDFGVVSVPTLIVIKDGEPVDKYVGYKNKEMLTTMISPFLK